MLMHEHVSVFQKWCKSAEGQKGKTKVRNKKVQQVWKFRDLRQKGQKETGKKNMATNLKL